MSSGLPLYNDKEAAYFGYDREDMLALVPAGIGSVLDVGCSSGGFGKLLKTKFNCEVWGIEPGEAAHAAKLKLDKVYHDIFHPGLDLGGKKFDLVVFNDVLEHLEDPWLAVGNAAGLLRPGGRILASIPNIQCYTVVRDLIVNGQWRYDTSGILDKTHLRFFTKKSIIGLFETSGLSIDRLEGMHPVTRYSRFLRVMNFFAPRRVSPFLYVSYGVLTNPVP